ncbi:TPA: hypothetical protein R7Q74_002656 [Acinetobacter baumannii]|nr:hypothetical protein [Acinetobacter baumannii]HEE6163280.1 hypothetical protein [Acinetobacter baumannii]
MFFIKSDQVEDSSFENTMYIVSDDSIGVKYDDSYSDEYDVYFYQTKRIKQAYWEKIERCIIQSRARVDLHILYHEIFEKNKGVSGLSDYCNLFEVLEALKLYNFSNKAFINFIRHFPILDEYIDHRNYNISAEEDSIRFHIWKNNINLVINFNNNYLIDFFSYDNDPDTVNDKLIYSMKGTFSSSSNLKKSYKIERLLSVLGDVRQDHDIKSISYNIYVESDHKEIKGSRVKLHTKSKLGNRVK